MNGISTVAEKVDGQRTIALLQDLVRIPSHTTQEKNAAEFIAGYMRQAGFDAVTVDDRHNVLGVVKGSGEGPSVLLLTHTDTAPPGKMENLYSGEIVDGAPLGKKGKVVWGRGAAAPKCACAAYIEGVRALIGWGRQNWRGQVLVACVTKDMTANHEVVKELHQSTGLKADYVIAGEPSDNQVVMGARGIAQVQITLHGIETHWGRPQEGVNPLYGLADILKRIETLQLPSHPVLGKATTAAVRVSSEDDAPRTPHTVRVLFDRRILPGETTEGVLADYRSILDEVCGARPGLRGEVERLRGMYSFQAPDSSPVKAALLEAGQAVTGRDIGTTYITFSSNAAFAIQELGIPGVSFAPGLITDVGDQEHAEVDRVIEGARITAVACAKLLA